MDELWTRLETFLKQNAPQVYGSLAPGAMEEEIADAEEACGITFPPDLRQSYLRHDGQADEGYNFIPGYLYLLPIQYVYSEAEAGVNYEVPHQIATDLRVKRVYDDLTWVAFAGNGGGDSLKLDFDPLPDGDIGQVIFWDHEESVRPVLAPDFRTWLNGIVDDLEAGRLVWNEELEGYHYPEA